MSVTYFHLSRDVSIIIGFYDRRTSQPWAHTLPDATCSSSRTYRLFRFGVLVFSAGSRGIAESPSRHRHAAQDPLRKVNRKTTNLGSLSSRTHVLPSPRSIIDDVQLSSVVTFTQMPSVLHSHASIPYFCRTPAPTGTPITEHTKVQHQDRNWIYPWPRSLMYVSISSPTIPNHYSYTSARACLVYGEQG